MPNDPNTAGQLSTGARWSIMIISLGVTASSFLFVNGVAFLIPALEARRGIPLAEASLLSSMPSWGMVATLVLWGYVLDRIGERIVLTVGSALTASAACAAASVHALLWMGVFLFLGGMATAAEMGRANLVGALSVPPSWGATGATINPVVSTTNIGAGAYQSLGATPIVMEDVGPVGMPGMPLAGMAGMADDEFSAPVYGFRPHIMGRPPAAG
jgi:MFS family permease